IPADIQESGGKGFPQPILKLDADYPLRVLYCGVCSLPTEYCEYISDMSKCRQWLDEFAKLTVEKSPKQESGIEKQKKGGRGQIKKKKTVPQKETIAKIPKPRRNTYVTRVSSLATYKTDLKEAQRFFAQKYSCGTLVTGEDEIIIQRDSTDNIIDK
uniref:SUI1 domain-containing protein n=1 Tax=Anolis carolinensis TaxID=28377 RepID=A0A803T4U8_ANOCA